SVVVELLRSSKELATYTPSCAFGLHGVIQIEVIRTYLSPIWVTHCRSQELIADPKTSSRRLRLL
ncbi:MAG: hypothetical protein LBS43_08135, partial [Prevotellaceae bacterium]|nr:hypothetical protein [Prevotellaceae bacterium]